MPMPGFQMHPGQMNAQQQQQMMQRMQPPQPNGGGMPSPALQRQFPGQGQGPPQQGQGTPTPNNAHPSQQPQFSTPQNPQGAPQIQTPNNAHQQQPLGANIQTPQTPTFPSNVHAATANGTSGSTPLSPGGDSRDKERISIILEINSELLWEATQIQQTQVVLKKEHASPKNGPANDVEKTEDEKMLDQDYVQ